VSKVIATGAALLVTMQAYAYAAQNPVAKGAAPTSSKAPPQRTQDIPKPPPIGQPPPKNQVVLPPPVQPAPRTIEQRIQNPQLRDLREPLPPPKQQGLTPLDRVGPAPGPERPVQPPPSNRSQEPPPTGIEPTYKSTF